jgi:hypothetical protein
MGPNDKEIQAQAKKLFEADFTPGFEQVWSAAEKRAAGKTSRLSRSRARYALVVVGGMAIVTALALVTTGRHGQRTAGRRANRNARSSLAELTDPCSWSAPLDGISGQSASDSLPMDGLLQREETVAKMAAGNASSDGDQYGCPTDFLLDLDVPVWNKAGERQKL